MASANVNDSSSASSQTTEKSSAAGVPMPDDLPNTIMIRDAPRELFEDAEQKANFASLFQGIDPNCQMVFLKSFQRVRVKFEKPEHATAAKLFLEHHSFNGLKMKGFLVKNIRMTQTSHQDEKGHLKPPPLEKQFLISPPTSPPVGWVQHVEMAPVICDFDLMARLAAFTVDDKYELHEGRIDDPDNPQPTIIVTPASGGVLGLGHAGSGSKSGINTNDSASEESSLLEQEMAMVNPSEIADDAISSDNDGSGGVSAGGGKVARPRTPRPPMPSMPNIKKI